LKPNIIEKATLEDQSQAIFILRSITQI